MKTYSVPRFGDGWVIEGTGERRLAPRLDLANHSPTGFSYGYLGSGCAQLALAILCDALGDDRRALRLYQQFKTDVVAKVPQDQRFEITLLDVLAAVEEIEKETAS